MGFQLVLPAPAQVHLDVFDVAGRRVARVVEAQLGAGSHRLTWDPQAAAGGMYFARLRSGGREVTRTVVRLP